MKLIFLWVSIIAIVGVAGAASLGTSIDVDVTGLGIFGSWVECKNNGAGWFCESTSEATGQTDLLAYEDPGVSVDSNPTGVFGSSSGCSPNAWASAAVANNPTGLNWPDGYLPEDKYGSPSYFNKIITISSGEDPTLGDALLSEGDGINKIARQSVAALLNSAHNEINYPISIIDAVSYTQGSIDNQEYSFADVLAVNNNLGKETLCDTVE